MSDISILMVIVQQKQQQQRRLRRPGDCRYLQSPYTDIVAKHTRNGIGGASERREGGRERERERKLGWAFSIRPSYERVSNKELPLLS